MQGLTVLLALFMVLHPLRKAPGIKIVGDIRIAVMTEVPIDVSLHSAHRHMDTVVMIVSPMPAIIQPDLLVIGVMAIIAGTILSQ